MVPLWALRHDTVLPKALEGALQNDPDRRPCRPSPPAHFLPSPMPSYGNGMGTFPRVRTQ